MQPSPSNRRRWVGGQGPHEPARVLWVGSHLGATRCRGPGSQLDGRKQRSQQRLRRRKWFEGDHRGGGVGKARVPPESGGWCPAGRPADLVHGVAEARSPVRLRLQECGKECGRCPRVRQRVWRPPRTPTAHLAPRGPHVGAVSVHRFTRVTVPGSQIPTGLRGPWGDRRGEQFAALRRAPGLLPTVQAPAAGRGVHRWKGGRARLRRVCPGPRGSPS